MWSGIKFTNRATTLLGNSRGQSTTPRIVLVHRTKRPDPARPKAARLYQLKSGQVLFCTSIDFALPFSSCRCPHNSSPCPAVSPSLSLSSRFAAPALSLSGHFAAPVPVLPPPRVTWSLACPPLHRLSFHPSLLPASPGGGRGSGIAALAAGLHRTDLGVELLAEGSQGDAVGRRRHANHPLMMLDGQSLPKGIHLCHSHSSRVRRPPSGTPQSRKRIPCCPA